MRTCALKLLYVLYHLTQRAQTECVNLCMMDEMSVLIAMFMHDPRHHSVIRTHVWFDLSAHLLAVICASSR